MKAWASQLCTWKLMARAKGVQTSQGQVHTIAGRARYFSPASESPPHARRCLGGHTWPQKKPLVSIRHCSRRQALKPCHPHRFCESLLLATFSYSRNTHSPMVSSWWLLALGECELNTQSQKKNTRGHNVLPARPRVGGDRHPACPFFRQPATRGRHPQARITG